MTAENKKSLPYYILSYFILWIILFEFILPGNDFLPKPSIVFQSFPDLVADYELLPNFISTVAVIYLALLAAYYSVRVLGFLPGKESRVVTNFIFSLEWFAEYIPGIVLGLLLIFWFPASEYIEFIFAYLAAFFNMVIAAQRSRSRVPDEYITSSRSLGLKERVISGNIYWKYAQAEIFTKMTGIHFNLWLVLIAFEYIKGGYGMGNIYHKALIYNDLSAFFSALIITGLTIYLGSSVIKYLKNKIIFWK